MGNTKAKKFSSFSGIVFEVAACDCEIGVIPQSKGQKKFTVHLYPNGKSVSHVTKGGKDRISSVVLPDLLAIEDGNVDDLKVFIERHGFLLPLESKANTSIDSKFLFALKDRLEATVLLMSAVAKTSQYDYEKIMALTMYLLLTPQVNICMSDGKLLFSSCPHPIGRLWNRKHTLDGDIQGQEDDVPESEIGFIFNEETNNNAGGKVSDSIRPPYTTVSLSEFSYAIDFFLENPSSVVGKIVYLFHSTKPVDAYCRLAIDFLYHVCNEVGEIKSWNHKGELEIAKNTFAMLRYTDIKPKESELADNKINPANSEVNDIEGNPSASAIFERRFDIQLQEGLLKLAKHTLKEELEYNLNGVVPSYDTNTLTPAWRIEHLLSGIYFSLFNMHAEKDCYRVCAKPNCNRYFFTQTDSTKQKYCSSSCANATAQSTHRRKKSSKHTASK